MFRGDLYSGRWYEFGKYPFHFETGCDFATADYLYFPLPQVIDVTNTCYVNNQAVKSDHAIANATSEPGIFKIRFDRFPQVESDYIVLGTDYVNYAFVGSEDKTMFWVLVRKQELSKDLVKFLIDKTEEFGFDPKRVLINESIKIN